MKDTNTSACTHPSWSQAGDGTGANAGKFACGVCGAIGREMRYLSVDGAIAAPAPQPDTTDWKAIARVQSAKLSVALHEPGAAERLSAVMASPDWRDAGETPSVSAAPRQPASDLRDLAEAFREVCARVIEQYGAVHHGIDYSTLARRINQVLDSTPELSPQPIITAPTDGTKFLAYKPGTIGWFSAVILTSDDMDCEYDGGVHCAWDHSYVEGATLWLPDPAVPGGQE